MSIKTTIILISPYSSNDLPHSHRSFVCTSIYGIFVFAQKNAARCIGEQNKNFELRILNYDTICIFCNI